MAGIIATAMVLAFIKIAMLERKLKAVMDYLNIEVVTENNKLRIRKEKRR